VNHAGDTVIENGGEGIDKVFSSVSHALDANVENLSLLGTKAIDGTGNTLANAIEGNAAANVLRGLGGNDRLFGLGGNDRLDGGTGIDTMTGGAGNDVYIQNAAGDSIVELPGGGTDTVQSSVTTTLGANVERLVLTGSGDIDGTGNSGSNALTGNSGRNVLAGSGGNDTLNGGSGKDTLNGGSGNDALAGGSGADSLNGGSGSDSMSGGTGNDLYVVDAAGDRVTELTDEGTDTVRSSVTRKLEANVEHLVLTGSALNGTGNGLDNEITGNGGHNRLSGAGGNDTLDGGTGRDTLVGGTGDDSLLGNSNNDSLSGGAGNDTLDGGAGRDTVRGGDGDDVYVSDSVDDVIEELADQGTDAVLSSVTHLLGENLEHLTLTGDSDINGTGNEMVNTITGNGGANVLDGGAGADSLMGGGGDDTLVWDAADALVDGGAGEADVLRVDAAALDLAGLAGVTILNTEQIDLADAGDQVLTLTLDDVLAMSSTSDELAVNGNVGDEVVVTDGEWTDAGEADGYKVYTLGDATLRIAVDVTVDIITV
jgi:Ca2+-binding RTX toxin-like protein